MPRIDSYKFQGSAILTPADGTKRKWLATAIIAEVDEDGMGFHAAHSGNGEGSKPRVAMCRAVNDAFSMLRYMKENLR